MKAYQGVLLSIEGGDGAGKSTQIQMLRQAIESKGHPVLLTREPGGSPVAEKIRSLVLDTANAGMDAVCEALLYAAARADHIAHCIEPALRAGKVVICDRFYDSSLAYQGGGRGLGAACIERINAPAMRGIMPDATLYLHLDAAEGLRRNRDAAKQADRLELEGDAFAKRVQQAFLQLARDSGGRIRIVDAAGTPQQVHERIIAALSDICLQEVKII